jgi:glutaredoxin-like protein
MIENREGQAVPKVTFRTRANDEWVDIDSEQLFAGKTVIVFSLPGAFTPTCSSTHLPRYNELAKTFRDNGVDDIICISVNDGFVMEAWQKDQNADQVRLIPDGNGEFTEGMGMLVPKNDLGFGNRSWRYSMLVKDGIIDKMFIEPEVEGDPFEVSDADTMLSYINSDAQQPEFVTLFTKLGCSHCERAKALLQEQSMDYEEVQLGHNVTTRTLRAISGNATTPQVFIGGRLIGSADDLQAYLNQ